MQSRRGFLKSIAIFSILPAVPAIPKPERTAGDPLQQLNKVIMEQMLPDIEAQLFQPTPMQAYWFNADGTTKLVNMAEGPTFIEYGDK